MKVFAEYSTKNEGGVYIDEAENENTLNFAMTKSTGTITGCVEGPAVSFKMDLGTMTIIEKNFAPAPNYTEMGRPEFGKHDEEVMELT